jgi:hypothetical protein
MPMGQSLPNNIESFTLGGEVAINLGAHWGVSFAAATPLFGKVIFKGNSYSGGAFLKLLKQYLIALWSKRP